MAESEAKAAQISPYRHAETSKAEAKRKSSTYSVSAGKNSMLKLSTHLANEPNTVPTADSTNTMKVTSSDKLDNKQNNKLTKLDADLAVVVEAWPELPDAIRSAIVAIVRSSNKQ